MHASCGYILLLRISIFVDVCFKRWECSLVVTVVVVCVCFGGFVIVTCVFFRFFIVSVCFCFVLLLLLMCYFIVVNNVFSFVLFSILWFDNKDFFMFYIILTGIS